jgi:hypothetical protein
MALHQPVPREAMPGELSLPLPVASSRPLLPVPQAVGVGIGLAQPTEEVAALLRCAE